MLSGTEHLDQAIRLTVHLILLPSDVYIVFFDVGISCLQSLRAASTTKTTTTTTKRNPVLSSYLLAHCTGWDSEAHSSALSSPFLLRGHFWRNVTPSGRFLSERGEQWF